MRIILLFPIIFLAHISIGQLSLSGYVFDELEQPHAYAQVSVNSVEQSWEIQTNEYGRFELHDLKIGSYQIIIITAYGMVRKDIKLIRSVELVTTVPRTVKMNEVVVKASRVDDQMPFTFDNINREEIKVRNLGQDAPYTLKWSPSIIATSDAGAGIGYTGMRIRGSDPTRVNVTINGIPLNDAESQAVFWVNLPDFSSSVESVQIQRGVGTSTNGAGAFGASINFNTATLNAEPFVQVNAGVGSFNTLRGNVSFGTGLLDGRWTIDGRISKIHSDGYIDRAETDLTSLYGSIARHGHYSSIRFNVFHGEEETYQAWNGVPAQFVDDKSTRTFNTAGMEKSDVPHDNEIDDYQQTHYQLLYNHQFNTFLRASGAVHYTRGKGYFEQYKAAQLLSEYLIESNGTSDLIRRRWLDNHFYGKTFNLNLQGSDVGFAIDLGGAFHRYTGRHFGEVIWAETETSLNGVQPYYDNDATKNDANVYAKFQIPLSNQLRGYVDLQQRWVSYEFLGLDVGGEALPQRDEHSFFNPKAGLNLSIQENKGMIYGSIAVAHKEPNRDDYTESTILSRPLSERLVNTEIGYRYKSEKVTGSLNFYHMKYDDQIVPTGQINDVGAATRRNVEDSYRTGIEADFRVQFSDRFNLQVQQSISQNRIKKFTEFVDNWDTGEQESILHEDTDLAFSPSAVSALIFQYDLLKKANNRLTIELANKFVGDQYLDNTSNENAKLDAYFYSDLRLSLQSKPLWCQDLQVHFQLNNVFNALYSSNGWIYRFVSEGYDPRPDDPYVVEDRPGRYNMIGYFPQATTNFLTGLTIRF